MGNRPNTFRVSVKGVVIDNDRVVLLLNERQEWELPGGGLERDESPQECVVREIEEETGWTVRCEEILDSWLYVVGPGEEVLIVTYGCTLLSGATVPRVSSEHTRIGLFPSTRSTACRCRRATDARSRTGARASPPQMHGRDLRGRDLDPAPASRGANHLRSTIRIPSRPCARTGPTVTP